jgi:antitoxin ParD1/3/4
MYIQITPELEQFIQAQLASGRFASADDVVNEAFKLLQEREQQIKKLREEISLGTEQIAAGQVTDGEFVFARLQEKIRQITEEFCGKIKTSAYFY